MLTLPALVALNQHYILVLEDADQVDAAHRLTSFFHDDTIPSYESSLSCIVQVLRVLSTKCVTRAKKSDIVQQITNYKLLEQDSFY